MIVSKTIDVSSNLIAGAIALVVQWIRIGDYGSSDKRSNRFESTNKVELVVAAGRSAKSTV